MGNDTQMSRRSFITRLTTVAGGLLVAGSATELLTGCSGGGGGVPSIPGTPPNLPPEVQQRFTIAQALALFTAFTGIAVGFNPATDVVAFNPNDPAVVAAVLARVVPAALAQLFFPDYGTAIIPNRNAAGNLTPVPPPVIRSAAAIGYDQDDIEEYAGILQRSLLIPNLAQTQNQIVAALGPNPVQFQFTLPGGITTFGLANGPANGSALVRFNSVLHATLGRVDGERAAGSLEDNFSNTCKNFNQAPDGHHHYDAEVGLSVNALGDITKTHQEVNIPNTLILSPPVQDFDARRQQGALTEGGFSGDPQRFNRVTVIVGQPLGGRVIARAIFRYKPAPQRNERALWTREVIVICAKIFNFPTGTGTGLGGGS
ncbi:MAG: hypothetical protein M3347_06975 [Armatimonadota bacterium]|nr:hypothetical protein [Armatimonadota bacterium]